MQVQCPNCKGYRVKKVDHTDGLKFAMFYCALFFITWLLEPLLLLAFILTKAGHMDCEWCRVGYICELCHFQFLRSSEHEPKRQIPANRDLIRKGEERLRTEEQAEQDAFGAYWQDQQRKG